MTLDRRGLLELAAGGSLLAATGASAQALPAGLPEPKEMIRLWPNGVPGIPAMRIAEQIIERSTDPQLTDRAIQHVTDPRMMVFRPLRPNGAAVLITPGGGYKWVVVDKEGYEIGRWLAARGFTAFVLFYRLPGDRWAAGPDVALSDAQRAMRLIRYRAQEYGVEPERVAAMGFSAGGHVCADLLTRYAVKTYAPVDAADRLSARPMIAAPIYPVVTMRPPLAHPGSRKELLGDGAEALQDAHSPERNVPHGAPPTFLVHAEDDDVVPVENSVLLHDALRAAKVPVEMHLFTNGGHGFGLRRVIGKPAGIWPELWANWAQTQGLF